MTNPIHKPLFGTTPEAVTNEPANRRETAYANSNAISRARRSRNRAVSVAVKIAAALLIALLCYGLGRLDGLRYGNDEIARGQSR